MSCRTALQKSPSFRVLFRYGVWILPSATRRNAIRLMVPWRMYSNSCSAGLPGRTGLSGYLRLNTHKSEGLVKLAAQECSLTADLGIKGKEGILKSSEACRQMLQIISIFFKGFRVIMLFRRVEPVTVFPGFNPCKFKEPLHRTVRKSCPMS